MPECHIASSEIRRQELCDDLPDKTIYKALPAGEFIRILKLQPGEIDQSIECSLEIVGIENSKGSYEAISYVWGDPNDTVEVQCNGLRVAITVSLADALRNFRHTSEPRVLWTDALCINQKDTQEKGHQVKRMGGVYANAKRTLVWLGGNNHNIAADAFALILEANVYFSDSFLQADQSFYKMEPFIPPYPICVDKDRWLGVASFFNHPWFKRVWTVQEAAIAEECRLYWGSVSIYLTDVLEICVWLSKKHDFRSTIHTVVEEMRYLRQRNINLYLQYNVHRPGRWQHSSPGLYYLATRFEEKTFVTVLRAARYLKASDPRDHVYAFLGCPAAIDSEGRTLVEVDYMSSLDDLNLRLAYVLMENAAEGPFVLPTVRHDSRLGLLNGVHPSWLPVWHVAQTYRHRLADERYWYKAGSTRELFTATQYGRNRLSVGACDFDTVIWRSSTMQPDYPTSKLDGVIINFLTSRLDGVFIDTLWDDVRQSSSRLGIAVRHVDFLRTLMIGYPELDSFSAVPDERQQSLFDVYRKSISVARSSNQEVVMEVDERRDATYIENELRWLSNGSIFITKNGRIGIAPRGDLVEVGDVCCIIFGTTVPFLLTPTEEGRHKLISECYIHGVMDGEIMEQFGQGDLSKHRIVLE